MMEVLSFARGDLAVSTAPSSAPSTRRTSRASSSPSGEDRTRYSASDPDSTTPMATPSPRRILPTELAKTPAKDGAPESTFDTSTLTPRPARPRRPPMGRFYSSDAPKPAPLATHFPSPTSQSSSQSSREHSPLRENDSPLLLARGETRRRAVSLGQIQAGAGTQTTSTQPRVESVQNGPFAFLSPAAGTPNTKSTKMTNHGTRRWHALMELVSTEDGYVKDLKILVRIYLVQLSSVESLTEADRQDIARNAAALLDLHKKLARRFNTIVEEEKLRELGPGTVSKIAQQKLERAIDRVASIFIREASSFHLYEAFCAGHSHALDLIRQVQTLPEWDMYEKRCAVIVADERANAEAMSPGSNAMATPNASTSGVSRRHSLDIGPAAGITLPRTSKLTMLDFLIKPVQRICRYPLILGQLQLPGASTVPSSVTRAMPVPTRPAVEHLALNSMKEVASKVDEARKISDIAIKTKLLLVRISDPPLPHMSSLGECLLVGSLDIIYHHETLAPLVPPIKVKYLGTFLYGGWIMFTKVHKNRTYEPRHWFPLANATLQDIPEEEALLPASFRLSCGEHHFELVAACLSEKNLWMDRIRAARVGSLQRANELPSSLENPMSKPSTPIKSPNRPPSRKLTTPVTATSDVIVSPPKRRSSLGALETWQIYLNNPQLLATLGSGSPEPVTPPSPLPIAPAQMRNLLEGDASTIHIRRSSANHRKMVDSSLSDVFFEECQTVRVQAQMKEPLFQPPKLTAESGSAITARDKVTRRESVLLRRQRSVAEGTPLGSSNSSSRPLSASKFSLARNKSAHSMGSSKEMRRRTLAIPSFSFFEEREEEKTKREKSRPTTTDYGNFSQPSTPVMTEFDTLPNEGITFTTRKTRAKRSISIVDRVASPEPIGTHPPPVSAPELNVLKELPPIPVKRRSQRLSSSIRRSGSELGRFATFSGYKSDKRPLSSPLPVYVVGNGISNVQSSHIDSTEKIRLRPATLFRKSWTLLASKSSRGASGLSNLFNRSSLSISREGEVDSHRARSEPPSTPPRRVSASTPTLGESLTAWEVVSEVGLLKRPDVPRSTSDSSSISDIPPVPPLPRHSQHLQPSSIRLRSSQFVQHLNRLS